METILNFTKFHLKKKRREEKTNDNRKQIPPTLKPTILYEKKLISNVKKKNEKSNTLERNNLEKISNKYKYPISQNRKEQIL